MAYNPRDFYFKKAKAENYAARSAFKLEEIDARFRILKSGDRVLDLGAAPGSWSQYASKKVGLKGHVFGVDLQPIRITLPNTTFVQGDLLKLDFDALLKERGFQPPFQVVLSDMAPKTTGVRLTDQMRSVELCDLALAIATRTLMKGGHFVAKLFHSEEFEAYRSRLRSVFKTVELLRPKSTRKESKEIFLIGLGFQPPNP